MKLLILFFSLLATLVNAEMVGNKTCIFYSASIEPVKCFRKAADCEKHLEDMSTSEPKRDITCKAR